MTATVRAVRRETARAERQLRGLGLDAASYYGRRHPWGYYLLRHAFLYPRGPRRRVPVRRRRINAHAVDHALYVGAWGSHVCRPFYVPARQP